MPRQQAAAPAATAIIRVDSWQAFLKLITDAAVHALGVPRRAATPEWPLYSALSRYLQTSQLSNLATWPEQEERIPAHLQTEGPPVWLPATSRSWMMTSSGWR